MGVRPSPTHTLHFTHIDHLASIVQDGLHADGSVGSRLTHEVGSRGVKEQRRSAEVPLTPFGVVSDYVPFYFAPRSPMMYAIRCGQVDEYGTDLSPLVYLVSTVEALGAVGARMLFTRRNAALRTAEFIDDLALLDDHVDWPLMREQYWNNTPTDGDRRARRMAECLVHGHVPWEAFQVVIAYDEERRVQAESILTRLDDETPVVAKGDWYF